MSFVADFKSQFTRDDLFMRVLLVVSALWFGAILLLLWTVVLTDDLPIWGRGLAAGIALVLGLYAALLLIGGISPARSWFRTRAERWFPDAADGDGLVLLLVVVLPAGLITLLLRLVGTRGSGA